MTTITPPTTMNGRGANPVPDESPPPRPPGAPSRPTFRIVLVTPAMAEVWLGRNEHNRNVRDHGVFAYGRDMAAGHWAFTGDSIKIDWHGRLLDGQHRLRAIQDSGISVEMLVVEGLDPATQTVIDNGMKRTAGDALKLGGYKNGLAVAGSARLAKAWLEGRLAPGVSAHLHKTTTAEVLEFVEEHPDIVQAVADGETYRKDGLIIRPMVINVALWRMSRISYDAAHEFFDSLAHSATNGAGDPRAALLQRMKKTERRTPTVELALTCRAWNAWRKGQTVHHLAVSRDGVIIIPEPR